MLNRFSAGKTPAYSSGLTLVELVLTIVILGFTLLILIPFFQAITHSPDPVIRERSVSLAHSMMDEILARKWDENTPNGGGPIATGESDRGLPSPASAIGRESDEGAVDRANWDDVDDYDGLAETDNFTDQGNNIVSLNGYGRSVTVRYIASNSAPITDVSPAGSSGAGTSTDTKRVVVAVTNPLGETLTLVGLSCNF